MSDLFYEVASIDYPILDADAHVNEPPDLWLDRMPSKWKDRAPRVVHTDDGDFWHFDQGKGTFPVGLTGVAGLGYIDFKPWGFRYEDLRPGHFETKARLEDMDADGIYLGVQYPSITLRGAGSYSDDPALQLACVRAYNEWMVEFCDGSNGRLVGLGIIPTTGVDDAVAELEWSIENGHKGVIITRFPNGGFDAEPEDRAFWGLAEEAKMPISVHIGSFHRDVAAAQAPNWESLQFVANACLVKSGGHTLPVVCDLMFAGIWDSFPDLRLIIVEANIGWIPTLLEQSDDMFSRYRWYTKAVEKMKGTPSEIFHRHFWAAFMIDTFGVENRHHMNKRHLLWSTDYPHSGSDWPNSRTTLLRNFRGIPAEDVKLMIHTNCKDLYNLDYVPDRFGDE